MRFWRISNFADLSGAGGKQNASRWNLAGNAMVYLADHPSTALLETLVHFRSENLPGTFQLLAIEAPDAIKISALTLPQDWNSQPDLTQEIGTKFITEGVFALAQIPSIIMPQASNFLLNPMHPAADQIRIVEKWRYPFDSRLLT